MKLYRGYNRDYSNWGVRPEQKYIWMTDDIDYALVYAKLFNNGGLVEFDVDENQLNLADDNDCREIFGDEWEYWNNGLIDVNNDIVQTLIDNGFNSAYVDNNGIDCFLLFDKNLIKSAKELPADNMVTENINEILKLSGVKQINEGTILYDVNIDDIFSHYDVEWVLDEFKNGNENIWYPLINSNEYKQALSEFVSYGGFIKFPVKKIVGWWKIIVKNVAILNAITDLSGHSYHFPTDEIKNYFFANDEEFYKYKKKLIDNRSTRYGEDIDYDISDEKVLMDYLEDIGFYSWAELPNGDIAWSDYGIKPMLDILEEYNERITAEELIVLINRILDVTHQNGDLPSAFIQGGSKSLTKITNESIEMNDEVIDVYGNELYKKLSIYDNGDLIGYTDYNVYEDKPYIQMINVKSEYRRKGYATKMIQHIQNRYPEEEIDFGMTTDDGSKFLEKLPKKVIKNGVYTRKLNRANELKKWLDNFSKYTNKDDISEEDAEYIRSHTYEWQKKYFEYNDLVNWLNDHKQQKVFIKTNKITESIEYDTSWKTKDGEDVFFTDIKNSSKKNFGMN